MFANITIPLRALCGLVAGARMEDNAAVTPEPIFYAHRGAAAEQPENTMPSFRRALELGADALETDVHMTADGHVVVSHDPGALRMTGVAMTLRRARLDEVQALDAGVGFVDAAGERPFVGKRYRIPTLEELLVELPGVPLNIDLKQPWPFMVDRVLALLRRLRATDRVTLASFHLRTLAAVRARRYEGTTGLSQPEVAALVLARGPLARVLRMAGRRAQIPTHAGPLTLASRGFIDRCHALGLAVDFWTINQADEARRLLDLGADGIMTDDPAAIAPVFAERRRSAP